MKSRTFFRGAHMSLEFYDDENRKCLGSLQIFETMMSAVADIKFDSNAAKTCVLITETHKDSF